MYVYIIIYNKYDLRAHSLTLRKTKYNYKNIWLYKWYNLQV